MSEKTSATCRLMQSRWHSSLFLNLGEAEQGAIRRHLQNCESCRQALACCFAPELSRQGELLPQKAPRGFTSRVMEAIEPGGPALRSMYHGTGRKMVGAAAGKRFRLQTMGNYALACAFTLIMFFSGGFGLLSDMGSQARTVNVRIGQICSGTERLFESTHWDTIWQNFRQGLISQVKGGTSNEK